MLGLVKPLWHEGKQYAQDAARIGDDWRLWLDQFTNIHDQLFSHSKTHPPFAVLLNYFPLHYGNVHVLTWFFIVLGTASIPLVNLVLRAVGVPPDRSNLLTLLFAVIPAINIYSVVSLDAVVLTASTLALLGLARLISDRKPLWGAVALFAVGVLACECPDLRGRLPLRSRPRVGAEEAGKNGTPDHSGSRAALLRRPALLVRI